MSIRLEGARARHAFGRLLLVTLAGACQTVGGVAPPTPALNPDPVLEEGPMSAADRDRAAVLFAQAREAYDVANWASARALAGRVVEAYPRSAVSGRALLLQAEAALADEAWTEADEAASRYAGLLGPDDPRGAGARLLASEAALGAGDWGGALRRLLPLTAQAPRNTLIRAGDVARRAASDIGRAELTTLVEQVEPDHPLAPLLYARLAFLVAEAGDTDRGQDLARAALDAGARGADSLVADAVLNPVVRRIRMATVLPLSGSPGLRDFAQKVAEGVAVAAAVEEGRLLEVSIASLDDAGDAGAAAAAVRALEEDDVLGAVGFLQDEILEAAARARTSPLTLVSPTARSADASGAGVFSLAGADPVAAATMARFAAEQRFERVAIIHSRAPESEQEAQAFQDAALRAGVRVVGRYAYDMGATFFQAQIRSAREVLRLSEIRALRLGPEDTLDVSTLDPVALFLPVPPEDVEFLAPQVTFFGLDTLGVQVLGTSGWTDAQVLAQVDPRHTTGVVATAPTGGGPGSAGYRRFREAFEALHRRSLVSPVPALGYDAALMLLEAARAGPGTRAGVGRALERLGDVEGATGTFYVLDGRILRRHEVVRILNRALVPAR